MLHLPRQQSYLAWGMALLASMTALPVLSEQTPPTTPVGNTIVQNQPLVMIDPGHGGKDPGAIGYDNLREVDVILPISLKVAEVLRQRGVAVQLTRDADYFVGLDERVIMSRQAGATIFVSIHANAIENRPDVQGLEVYHYRRGEVLANTVHRQVLAALAQESPTPLADRGVRLARFLVLRKSEIPAILIETGYLTSPTESPMLATPAYRDKMAVAIANGIVEYLQGGTTGVVPNDQPPTTAPQPR
jgi:N-acetylmuramoyl-L-alanine amidase